MTRLLLCEPSRRLYLIQKRPCLWFHYAFRSAVRSDTLSPVWNELWKVKNVPSNATLHVRVMDKDSDQPKDGYIGQFETTVNSGTKEVEIEGPMLQRIRGNFWFKVVNSYQRLNLCCPYKSYFGSRLSQNRQKKSMILNTHIYSTVPSDSLAISHLSWAISPIWTTSASTPPGKCTSEASQYFLTIRNSIGTAITKPLRVYSRVPHRSSYDLVSKQDTDYSMLVL